MIHKFKTAEYNIVLDVNSGCIHVVDNLTYDILDNIEPPPGAECPEKILEKLKKFYSVDDIVSCYSEIYEVYRDGMLFTESDSDEESDREPSPLRAVCLNISHDCNLRCGYCFARNGSFGGERTMMGRDTAEKAVEFLIEYSGYISNPEIYFFGGEPLMNFDVLRHTVEYARSREEQTGKKFRFSVTTNGTLLDDEKTAFLNSEIDMVVLSADGRREVNDSVRRRADGTGVYDEIMPAFKKLTEGRNGKNYCIRGTFSRKNTDFSKDVLSIAELGFDSVSVEPVAAGSSPEYEITEMEIPSVFREYDRLAEIILQKEKEGKFIDFFPFRTEVYETGCRERRENGCSCGNEYVAVTPDGNIYPCHRLAGEQQLCLGNISTGFAGSNVRNLFCSSGVRTKPECRECWAKFYCSGGCSAAAFYMNGDINTPHRLTCMITKKRIECALALETARAVRDGKI